MRFVENRDAGRGIREFHNVDTSEESFPFDLARSTRVRQTGTVRTGGIERVAVFYPDSIRSREREFFGADAHRVLRVVAQHLRTSL